MADVQIIGPDRLDLCEEADTVKRLAGSLWMATRSLTTPEDRDALSALASLVEDRIADLSRRLFAAADVGSGD